MRESKRFQAIRRIKGMKRRIKELEKENRRQASADYLNTLGKTRDLLAEFARKYYPEIIDRHLTAICSNPEALPFFVSELLDKAEKLTAPALFIKEKIAKSIGFVAIWAWAIRSILRDLRFGIEKNRRNRRATRYRKLIKRQNRRDQKWQKYH